MKNAKASPFQVILNITLCVANAVHLLWTVWLTVEQARTGWGYGTDMELAALFPWLTELICLPAWIAAGVYLGVSLLPSHTKQYPKLTLGLFIALAVQFGLTNIFIWY